MPMPVFRPRRISAKPSILRPSWFFALEVLRFSWLLIRGAAKGFGRNFRYPPSLCTSRNTVLCPCYPFSHFRRNTDVRCVENFQVRLRRGRNKKTLVRTLPPGSWASMMPNLFFKRIWPKRFCFFVEFAICARAVFFFLKK